MVIYRKVVKVLRDFAYPYFDLTILIAMLSMLLILRFLGLASNSTVITSLVIGLFIFYVTSQATRGYRCNTLLNVRGKLLYRQDKLWLILIVFNNERDRIFIDRLELVSHNCYNFIISRWVDPYEVAIIDLGVLNPRLVRLVEDCKIARLYVSMDCGGRRKIKHVVLYKEDLIIRGRRNMS